MPKKPKEKMSVEMRAKQFMPFSALTGLDEALKRVEEEMAHSGETLYEQGIWDSNSAADKSGDT